MSETAKPCPFCGVEVRLSFGDPDNVSGLVEHPKTGGCPLTGALMPFPNWNRRAPVDLQAVLEAHEIDIRPPETEDDEYRVYCSTCGILYGDYSYGDCVQEGHAHVAAMLRGNDG